MKIRKANDTFLVGSYNFLNVTEEPLETPFSVPKPVGDRPAVFDFATEFLFDGSVPPENPDGPFGFVFATVVFFVWMNSYFFLACSGPTARSALRAIVKQGMQATQAKAHEPVIVPVEFVSEPLEGEDDGDCQTFGTAYINLMQIFDQQRDLVRFVFLEESRNSI
jgi:hypothetical protein